MLFSTFFCTFAPAMKIQVLFLALMLALGARAQTVEEMVMTATDADTCRGRWCSGQVEITQWDNYKVSIRIRRGTAGEEPDGEPSGVVAATGMGEAAGVSSMSRPFSSAKSVPGITKKFLMSI